MSILCARFGIVDLAAHTVALNYASVLFVFCLGVGSATCTFVGNSIGEKKVVNAKRYAMIGSVLALLLVGTFGSQLIIFRHFFSTIFTTEQDIVDKLEILVIICAIAELFDGLQGTLGKVLIGMGRQAYASLVNLASYYALMIPSGIVLGYVLGYGVIGVWIALTLGSVAATSGFSWIILHQDWSKLVKEAEERAIKENSVSNKTEV